MNAYEADVVFISVDKIVSVSKTAKTKGVIGESRVITSDGGLYQVNEDVDAIVKELEKSK